MNPSGAAPVLSIVFSYRNEEEVLPELLRRCRAMGAALVGERRISSMEMVFVDDDSNDGSVALLNRELEKGAKDIRVVCMSRRFGVSVCVLVGMKYSVGDWVVYMDADLQDPPEMIPEMIDVVEKSPDTQVVHTKRSGRDGESRMKLYVTHIGYWILHFLTRGQLPVECGDFKLLTRRAVTEVLRFKERNLSCDGWCASLDSSRNLSLIGASPAGEGKLISTFLAGRSFPISSNLRLSPRPSFRCISLALQDCLVHFFAEASCAIF
jgi:glycosyltransferase involved in cell wall biosynthesis